VELTCCGRLGNGVMLVNRKQVFIMALKAAKQLQVLRTMENDDLRREQPKTKKCYVKSDDEKEERWESSFGFLSSLY
jgi:hypothetical protein